MKKLYVIFFGLCVLSSCKIPNVTDDFEKNESRPEIVLPYGEMISDLEIQYENNDFILNNKKISEKQLNVGVIIGDDPDVYNALCRAFPPVLSNSNVHLTNSGELHIEFEVYTYSPPVGDNSGLDFIFQAFYWNDFGGGIDNLDFVIEIPDSSIAYQTEYARCDASFVFWDVMETKSVLKYPQYRLKVEYNYPLNSETLNKLSDGLWYRVYYQDEQLVNSLGSVLGYDCRELYTGLRISNLLDSSTGESNYNYSEGQTSAFYYVQADESPRNVTISTLDRQSRAISIDEEYEWRRVVGQLNPSILYSSNVFPHDEDTLKFEFSIITYSPIEDMDFVVDIHDKNINIVTENIKCSEQSGFNISKRDITDNNFVASYESENGIEILRANVYDISFYYTVPRLDIPNTAEHIYYRVKCKNAYVNQLMSDDCWQDFTNIYSSVYIPKILEENLGDGNSHYSGHEYNNDGIIEEVEWQEFSQRFIKVKTWPVMERITGTTTGIEGFKVRKPLLEPEIQLTGCLIDPIISALMDGALEQFIKDIYDLTSSPSPLSFLTLILNICDEVLEFNDVLFVQIYRNGQYLDSKYIVDGFDFPNDTSNISFVIGLDYLNEYTDVRDDCEYFTNPVELDFSYTWRSLGGIFAWRKTQPTIEILSVDELNELRLTKFSYLLFSEVKLSESELFGVIESDVSEINEICFDFKSRWKDFKQVFYGITFHL